MLCVNIRKIFLIELEKKTYQNANKTVRNEAEKFSSYIMFFNNLLSNKINVISKMHINQIKRLNNLINFELQNDDFNLVKVQFYYVYINNKLYLSKFKSRYKLVT